MRVDVHRAFDCYGWALIPDPKVLVALETLNKNRVELETRLLWKAQRGEDVVVSSTVGIHKLNL